MYQSGRDTKLLTGGMDTDTESRQLGQENYRFLLNARNSIGTQGNFGAIEDMNGNLLVSVPLAIGRNKCIGNREDTTQQSLLYLIWNEFGYHTIFRWFAPRDNFPIGYIDKLYQITYPFLYDPADPDPLGFTEDDYVTGINLVDETLYWTNNVVEPKAANLARFNRTNKKLKYNLYLYPDYLSFTTNYTIRYDSQIVPISGITTTFSTAAVELIDRLEAATIAINTGAINQYFRAVNKSNYVEIEALFVGDAWMGISENSTLNPDIQFVSKIIPQNFVPDKEISASVGSYNKTLPWHTNNIKTPARCGPTASYTVDLAHADKRVYAEIFSSVTVLPLPPVPGTGIFIGAINDNTPPFYDNAGDWNPGATTVGLITSFPSASLIPTTNGSWAFDLQANIEVSVLGEFYVLVSLVGSTSGRIMTYRSRLFSNGTNAGESFVHWTGNFQAEITESYAFFVEVNYATTPISLTGVQITGTFKFDSAAASLGVNLNTPYLFRTKYIYKDFENAVYSAWSTTPYPITFKENSLRIDFTDLYLSDPSYLSYIKNVVLCYSLDGGTTWFDLRSLEQYEFSVKTTYLFSGNEFLRTVPESEALLQFHSVPRIAKSQEYADERIWYGGLTEGYNLVPTDIDFTVQYPEGNDATIYPPERQIIIPGLPTTLRGDAGGSFWERGYDGYIGIVYMDDYDRKTFVNLAPNSHIYTKYFSEPINGVLNQSAVATIDWAINSPPPAWATKYQFVRTKNIRCTNFLEWAPVLGFADTRFNEVPFETYTVITVSNVGPAGTEVLNNILINGVSQIAGPFGVSTPDVLNQIVDQVNGYWGFGKAVRIGDKVFIMANPGDSCSMSINGVDSEYTMSPGLKCDCYSLDFIGVADYNAYYNAQLEFTFQVNDYVIFRALNYPTQRVLGVVGNIAYVKATTDFTYGANAGVNVPVQIFSVNILTPQIFYEFGECYEVYTGTFNGLPRKYHRGETQDQTPTLPATGNFGYGNGNVWYRVGCSYIVNSETDEPVYFGGQFFGQRKTMTDFTPVVSDNNGRTNIISQIGEQYRPSAFRFSDQYISSTEINGTNAFQPLNEKQLNTDYGLMEKMQVINNDVLKLIFGNSNQVSIYVRQAALQLSQGSGTLIGVADSVAGEAHIIQRTLGTNNAESIGVNDEGDMMGYDENEGVVWISSGNGLIQISDRGKKNDWKRYSNERRPLGKKKSKAPAIFDIFHDEYIITLDSIPLLEEVEPQVDVEAADLPTTTGYVVKIEHLPSGTVYYNGPSFTTTTSILIQSILTMNGYTWTGVGSTFIAPDYANYTGTLIQVTITNNSTGAFEVFESRFYGGRPAQQGTPFDGVTLIYSKKKGLWTEYASFVPEMYGRVRDYIVAFKDGQLWVQDQNPIPRNFFGVQYPRILTIVSNRDYPKVKDYKAMSITGIGTNSCPAITVAPYEGNPSGMLSALSERFFQTKEGIQYSHFLKDKLTPGQSSQLQALANGRNLKGQNIEIEIQHDAVDKSLIYSVDVIYFYSENS